MIHELVPSEKQSCMEALQTAGRIIIENGGETYRAEETICRMGQGFGMAEVECFAVPSGLFISYRKTDGLLETSVQRIHRQGTNLTRIDEVNRVSRGAFAGEIDLKTALIRLRQIEEDEGPIPRGWKFPAAFACAAGFALIFGGEWREMFLAGIVAAAVQGVNLLLARMHLQWLAAAIAGGFLTAFLPRVLNHWFPGFAMELVTAGALMPLVPGLAMTNAVQDAMRGDMISGLSHGCQAALTACMIAGGALLSATVIRLLEGGGL